MELSNFFDEIHPMVRAISIMKKFIHDEMYKLLEAIGDTQLNSAIRTLRDIKISSSPNREIESAITQLRVANEYFISNTSDELGFFKTLGRELAVFNFHKGWQIDMRLYGKSYMCTVLIAISYRSLGENSVLPTQTVGIAHKNS